MTLDQVVAEHGFDRAGVVAYLDEVAAAHKIGRRVDPEMLRGVRADWPSRFDEAGGYAIALEGARWALEPLVAFIRGEAPRKTVVVEVPLFDLEVA